MGQTVEFWQARNAELQQANTELLEKNRALRALVEKQAEQLERQFGLCCALVTQLQRKNDEEEACKDPTLARVPDGGGGGGNQGE